ncbi:MAG: hypothetical protein QXF40_01135 [Metallosphaera sp.]
MVLIIVTNGKYYAPFEAPHVDQTIYDVLNVLKNDMQFYVIGSRILGFPSAVMAWNSKLYGPQYVHDNFAFVDIEKITGEKATICDWNTGVCQERVFDMFDDYAQSLEGLYGEPIFFELKKADTSIPLSVYRKMTYTICEYSMIYNFEVTTNKVTTLGHFLTHYAAMMPFRYNLNTLKDVAGAATEVHYMPKFVSYNNYAVLDVENFSLTGPRLRYKDIRTIATGPFYGCPFVDDTLDFVE